MARALTASVDNEIRRDELDLYESVKGAGSPLGSSASLVVNLRRGTYYLSCSQPRFSGTQVDWRLSPVEADC